MGKFAKLALVVLLLALPVSAIVASIPVPAVFTTHGAELVGLVVEIRDGRGDVYVATTPLVGIQTQDSARIAFTVARSRAGVGNSYDALIRFKDASGSKSVDGPSAGAAMTLLMLSMLENKTIRSDLTMTGTIETDGSVGEVGEVGAKTKAAADEGMKVMLIPVNSDVYEKMVFSILGSRWNITIIEVKNISQVANLAFTDSNVTLQSNVMEVSPNPAVNITAAEINCTDCHIEEFKALANGIIEKNSALLAEVSSENRSEFSYFIKMIAADIEASKNAEDWNYPYTGANMAFLTAIDLNFLKDSNVTYDSFRSRMLDIDSCISSASRPKMTEENFEWVTGGDERLAWSKKKLYEVFEQNYSSYDDETILLLYESLLNAESWCNVSHDMYSIAANIGGTPVNESKLKQFAADKIAEADDKLKALGVADFGDAEWRFEAAKDEFNKSEFSAAVFDSNYLLSAMEASNSSQDVDSFATAEFESPRTWNGMWAALYENHAKYIYLKSKAVGGSAAASIMLVDYAYLLDNDTVKMKELLQAPAVTENVSSATTLNGQLPTDYENELAILLVFCIIVAIFLNLVQFFKPAE